MTIIATTMAKNIKYGKRPRGTVAAMDLHDANAERSPVMNEIRPTIERDSAADVAAWRGQRPEEALTLPSRYFYDDAVFEAEKGNVFMPGWQIIGHKSELSEPGRFIRCDLFDQSIIAAADKDGTVHAFHNVCQHRGNRLVEERRGQRQSVFKCSYHSWCYGLDGSLRGAPRSERLAGFRREDFGLKPVRIEEFAGFLYFNLDPDAPSMAEQMPGAEDEIRRNLPDIDDVRFVDERDYVVPANWKVIMDNAIEGYHFDTSGPVHETLAALIRFEDYTLTPHGKWWTYVGPTNLEATEAYGVPLGDGKNPDDRFFNVNLWPANTLYRFPYSGFIGTFVMIPLAPEKTLLRMGYYAADGRMDAVTEACMRWMNEELGPEDIDLNVTVQKGLRSLGYDQGRYLIDAERSHTSEHLVHHFHQQVFDAIHG